jgi:hypothetical protein
MPYLPLGDRLHADYCIKIFLDYYGSKTFRGVFNYFIHKLVKEYIKRFGENYNAYKEIIGEIEAAKLELYRKMVVPYEEHKERENGDVE